MLAPAGLSSAARVASGQPAGSSAPGSAWKRIASDCQPPSMLPESSSRSPPAIQRS